MEMSRKTMPDLISDRGDALIASRTQIDLKCQYCPPVRVTFIIRRYYGSDTWEIEDSENRTTAEPA